MKQQTLYKLYLSVFLLFCSLTGVSQELDIQGKVVGKTNKEPLAFVNVIYGDPPKGTTTNIDGEFKLSLSEPSAIEFSYLGYKTKIFDSHKLSSNGFVQIEMEKTSYDLGQILVMPGYNPANNIISKVNRNKNQNHPSSLSSFSYKSYNKMTFTVDSFGLEDIPGGGELDSLIIDTSELRLQKMLANQYLFLMETISKRKFQAPDKEKEYVTASRVSGFKDPSLVILATQFQSFSFYDDFVTIGDNNYLNPITKNSYKKYQFKVEDTLFVSDADSIFIISFFPKKGKNFDGLKGMLHIHTNGYALQKVIAEPVYPPSDFTIKIQHRYEFIENRQWFPSQLDTKIVFHNFKTGGKRDNYTLSGDGRTYIKDIEINPEIDHRFFDKLDVEIPYDAYHQSNEFWAQNRSHELSEKEERTYEVIDSLGEANDFDDKLKMVRMATTGYYPYKFLDIDYRKLLSYNQYEGFRMGFGGMTNDKISPWFSVGGYFAYGFKDKEVKYGGDLELFLDETKETKMHLSYQNDVAELGSYQFLMDRNLSSLENFRDYLVEDMNPEERIEGSVTFRLLRYLKMNAFINQYQIESMEPYVYSHENTDYSGNFHFSDAGIKLKYAYKEKLIKTPWGLISEGTDYPVLYANLTRGNQWFDGNFSNLRLEGRISETFTTKNLGKTHIHLMGGYASGTLPVFNMYNGNGSYTSRFALQIDNSFATMQLNEFFAQRFASIFLRQDMVSLLFRTDNFSPRLSVVTNMGWGWLDNMEHHENMMLKSFEEGYFESGLLLDNLLSVNFFSYGLGLYYRYGPYAFPKPADNFAYKFSLRINF
ncbi:MAG: DUF5686 family protein [Bacteroidales bacterium]